MQLQQFWADFQIIFHVFVIFNKKKNLQQNILFPKYFSQHGQNSPQNKQMTAWDSGNKASQTPWPCQQIRCCTSNYCVHTLNTKTIHSNLNSLNTFTKETGSPDVKLVLIRSNFQKLDPMQQSLSLWGQGPINKPRSNDRLGCFFACSGSVLAQAPPLRNVHSLEAYPTPNNLKYTLAL